MTVPTNCINNPSFGAPSWYGCRTPVKGIAACVGKASRATLVSGKTIDNGRSRLLLDPALASSHFAHDCRYHEAGLYSWKKMSQANARRADSIPPSTSKRVFCCSNVGEKTQTSDSRMSIDDTTPVRRFHSLVVPAVYPVC